MDELLDFNYYFSRNTSPNINEPWNKIVWDKSVSNIVGSRSVELPRKPFKSTSQKYAY